jgi:hypothetical protein
MYGFGNATALPEASATALAAGQHLRLEVLAGEGLGSNAGWLVEHVTAGDADDVTITVWVG